MRLIILTLILTLLPWGVRAETLLNNDCFEIIKLDSARFVCTIGPVGEDKVDTLYNENYLKSLVPVTKIEIFHGPTREAVRDYANDWLMKRGVEVVDVDMMRDYRDSICDYKFAGRITEYILTVTYREWREK